jgi:hypothetical protein
MQQRFGDAYYEDEDDDPNFVSTMKGKLNTGDYDGDDDDIEGLAALDYENGAQDGYEDEEQEYGDGYVDENNEEEYDDYEDGETGVSEGKLKRKAKKHGVSEMLDELYQLDYEDIVSGIPCRFKYRKVEPEDYGLNIDDILNAEDNELNQYLSLKKLAPYQRKGRQSEFTTPGDDDDAEGTTVASKMSKRRKKLRAAIRARMEQAQLEPEVKVLELAPEAVGSITAEVNTDSSTKKKNRRHKKKSETVDSENTEIPSPATKTQVIVEKPAKKKNSQKITRPEKVVNPVAKRMSLYK